MLQQRLADMKKTLQRELKVPVNTIDPGGTDSDGFIPAYAPCTSSGSNIAVLTPSSTQQMNVTPKYRSEVDEEMNDDVNFKYLKHVLIKFLTSREYEVSSRQNQAKIIFCNLILLLMRNKKLTGFAMQMALAHIRQLNVRLKCIFTWGYIYGIHFSQMKNILPTFY